jgi:hypothetical protein
MQFLRSVESGRFEAKPARIARCDHCGSVLDDRRVLTRDNEGRTRRFCGEDGVCIEAWQRYNTSVFRR